MSHMGGIELNFYGSPHAWDNGKSCLQVIRERLDMVICKDYSRLNFPMATISQLICGISYHHHILLDVYFDNNSRIKPFRFILAWFRHKSYMDAIARV